MIRAIDALDGRFRPLAMELLARLLEEGIPVLIVNTLRTAEEQAEAVRTGHSKVKRSKHQDGLAIDIVPYETFERLGPDKLKWSVDESSAVMWKRVGAIGQKIGLRWGGTFTPLDRFGIGWDAGHFELVIPEKKTQESRPV